MSWLFWSLLSAVFAALTAILSKVGVSKVDSDVATALRTSVVVIFAWLMVWITGARNIRSIPGKSWLPLVMSGIATGLSWWCYFHALKVGEASRVASIDKLSVVLVIIFAAIFLSEHLTLAKGIGALLMTAGAIVIAMDQSS